MFFFYLEPNLGWWCFSTSFWEDDNFCSAKALANQEIEVNSCGGSLPWYYRTLKKYLLLIRNSIHTGGLGINKPLIFTKCHHHPHIELSLTCSSNRERNDVHENHPRNFSCYFCPCRSGGPATGGTCRCVLLEPVPIYTSLID